MVKQFAILPEELSIEKGEMVALVGPSGAGKSTLINLLPRFFDPDQGAVRIDGIDIRDMDILNLRNQVSYVPQDVFLFSETVSGNIAFGLDTVQDGRAQQHQPSFAAAVEFSTVLRAANRDDHGARPVGQNALPRPGPVGHPVRTWEGPYR